LFAGQYRSKIMCPDCKKVSITFDPFLSVTLQFPRPDKGEPLEGYFMTE
jgi:ubiquitin C-terminal hydrolase